MSDLSDLVAEVNDWTNHSYDTSKVAKWVAMAEDRINDQLRIADMIEIDRALITDERAALPTDWLETDFIRLVGGSPLRLLDRHKFYTQANTSGYFTTIGKYIFIGGAPDLVNGKNVEISYFKRVPRLANGDNWLNQNYHRLLLTATLTFASMYGFEDPRAATWEAYVADAIATLNTEYMVAKAKGSRMRMPQQKGFE